MSQELSDRELDALVAEKVMGYRWMSRVGQNAAWLFSPDSKDVDTWKTGLFGEKIMVRGCIVGPFQEYKEGDRKNESDVPRYSTKIASAMEVVEKMFADGWAVEIGRSIEDGKPLDYFGWDVAFHGGNPRKGRVVEREDSSLPRAICLAALAALSQTEGGAN